MPNPFIKCHTFVLEIIFMQFLKLFSFCWSIIINFSHSISSLFASGERSIDFQWVEKSAHPVSDENLGDYHRAKVSGGMYYSEESRNYELSDNGLGKSENQEGSEQFLLHELG